MLPERPETKKEAEQRLRQTMIDRIQVVESGRYMRGGKAQEKRARAVAYVVPLEAWGAKEVVKKKGGSL